MRETRSGVDALASAYIMGDDSRAGKASGIVVHANPKECEHPMRLFSQRTSRGLKPLILFDTLAEFRILDRIARTVVSPFKSIAPDHGYQGDYKEW